MIREESNIESVVRDFPATAPVFAVLVEHRYLEQSQPAGLTRALRARGYHVATIVAEEAVLGRELFEGVDLLVARGRSWNLLSALSWGEALGIRSINRHSAIAAVHNKAEMTLRLTSSGMPTPPTLVGSPQQLAARASRDLYPILLKPVYGDNGCGIQLVGSPEEMKRARGPVVLAQRFVPNDGFDLKLYCIGELTFAVRKACSVACLQAVLPSGARHVTGAELIPVTDEMRKIARRCAELFGLELFGVDMLETAQGLMVIEVNDFPNYTAVPQASELIANHVCACIREEKQK